MSSSSSRRFGLVFQQERLAFQHCPRPGFDGYAGPAGQPECVDQALHAPLVDPVIDRLARYPADGHSRGVVRQIGIAPQCLQKPYPKIYQPFSFSPETIRWCAHEHIMPIILYTDIEKLRSGAPHSHWTKQSRVARDKWPTAHTM